MAAFEHMSTSGVSGRFGLFVADLSARLVAWNDKRQTRIALNKLSERELTDIGLTRADIEALR